MEQNKIYTIPEEHRRELQEYKGGSVGSFILEIVKIVVICLAIIIPVRFFIIQPFFVKGDSMEPSFSNREYLIIDQVSYRFSDIERGDVVVFRYPKDPSQFYIKRVIGLPGETVEIEESNVTILNNEYPNGIVLEENYLPQNFETPGELTLRLLDEEYFVMGDNRTASSDSRVWGGLPQENIVGKVWLRVLPFNKAQAFGAPQYKAVAN